MGKIIGFSGRCFSGKTELAKLCEKYGYIRLSFGLPLKTLLSQILNITIEDINKLKKEGLNFYFKDCDKQFLSKEAQIPYDKISEIVDNRIFHNTRDLMQVIGTDIIRKYNQDWHVMRLKKEINSINNFVIDDIRFPNEKKLIEQLDGINWYIIRPNLEIPISNHVSETALSWRDFNNIIINNSTKEELIKLFHNIYENGINESKENIFMVNPISYHNLKLKDNLYDKIKDLKQVDNNTIKISLIDNTQFLIDNPFIIEDVKKYL